MPAMGGAISKPATCKRRTITAMGSDGLAEDFSACGEGEGRRFNAICPASRRSISTCHAKSRNGIQSSAKSSITSQGPSESRSSSRLRRWLSGN